MNLLLVGLLVIVLVYLQLHFLSYLNILMVILLVGLYFAVRGSPTLSFLYMGALTLIILASMVFRVSEIIKSIKNFKEDNGENAKPEPSISKYVSKRPLSAIPGDFVELDMTDELKKTSCEQEGFFAPSRFIEGDEASSKLDQCTSACLKNAKCSMVVLPNIGGKNDECKFYGGSDVATVDKTKNLLDSLNSSQDMMEATHYALIRT